MNQVLSQKYQVSKNELILGFVSGSTASVFEDLENITNTYRPESTRFQGIKYYQFADTIYGFSNLQNDWDTYNANVISQNAIYTAIKTLNHLNSKGQLTSEFAVNIFPMRDGGIQFEFDSENLIAELEISPEGNLTLIHFDDEGNIIGKTQKLLISELSTLLKEAHYAL
ncbi:MAG: hypothetical protein U9R42_07960 [Bacteroidota bacterium]|nr:hypothetical protein [Bacteroidota bacterium]